MYTHLRGEPVENFLLYALAVVARSDAQQIDRRYTTPADYAADALAYLDFDGDDIEIRQDVIADFGRFRATRRLFDAQPVDQQPESLLSELERAYASGDMEEMAGEGKQAGPIDNHDQLTKLRKEKDVSAWLFNLALFGLAIGAGAKWGWPTGLILICTVYLVVFAITTIAASGQVRKMEGGKQ